MLEAIKIKGFVCFKVLFPSTSAPTQRKKLITFSVEDTETKGQIGRKGKKNQPAVTVACIHLKRALSDLTLIVYWAQYLSNIFTTTGSNLRWTSSEGYKE